MSVQIGYYDGLHDGEQRAFDWLARLIEEEIAHSVAYVESAPKAEDLIRVTGSLEAFELVRDLIVARRKKVAA